jgi:hypothetical protein
MIENDVSIDKESGAYDKDYFLHTSKSFQNAAEFNKKPIAMTMIEDLSQIIGRAESSLQQSNGSEITLL